MLRSDSYKSGVINSVLLNMVSKGLVFLVNIVIIANFGSSESTDIFFFCFSLNILIIAFFSSLSTAVVVPGMLYLEQEGKRRSTGYVNRLYLGFLSLISMLALLIYAFPVEIPNFLSRFDKIELSRHVSIIRLSMIALVLQGVGTLFNDLLNAKMYFIIPSLIAVLNSAIIIIIVFLLGDTYGVQIVFGANILSYFFSVIIQIVILKYRVKWIFRLKDLLLRIENFHFKNLSFTAIGNSFTVLAAYVPMYLFSGENDGWLTSFNIGQRIAEIPNSLLFTQFAAVLGIQFTQYGVSKDRDNLNKSFLRFSEILLFISIPISLFLSHYSFQITSIIFGHGNKIKKENLILAAQLLQVLALATPFIGINALVSKLILGLQLVKHAFCYQISINILVITLSFLLFNAIGSIGYALGYTASYFINFFLSYLLLAKIAPSIQFKLVFISWLKLLLVNACVLSFLHLVNEHLLRNDLSLISLVFQAAVYLSLVIVANHIFNLNKDLTNEFNKIRNLIYSWIRFF